MINKKIAGLKFEILNMFQKKRFKIGKMTLFADTKKSARFLFDEIFAENNYKFKFKNDEAITIIDAGANMGWARA